ncbi:MAG: cation:proton antiporter [Rhodospirillaceae bacterium]
MDGHSDITGLAIVILAAMACGVVMSRLRQPPILGYILCGVLLGPSGFAMIDAREDITLMAELGVLMLLFVLGLELRVQSLLQVWRIAVFGTVIQVAGSVGVMVLLKDLLQISLPLAVLLGFGLALSSTAVVIKLLEQIGALYSHTGRVIMGILIAQDMAVAPMIMTLNGLAGEGFSWLDGVKVVGSVVVLVGLVLLLSRGPLKLPLASFASKNKDLAPVAGLAYCFGAASVTGLLGLSAGYGAFLAGLLLGNSEAGAKMESQAHTIQSVLLMVFFLSVGLLLDLTFLIDNLGLVLFLVAMVLIFKTMLNMIGLRLLGLDWPRAILSAVALAQVGEFSFILSNLGLVLGILTASQSQLFVATTVLSLTVTPLWVATARKIGGSARRRPMTHFTDVLDSLFGPGFRLFRRRLKARKPLPKPAADTAPETEETQNSVEGSTPEPPREPGADPAPPETLQADRGTHA